MEIQKGTYEDYSPYKRGLYGFPCKFGGVSHFVVWGRMNIETLIGDGVIHPYSNCP